MMATPFYILTNRAQGFPFLPYPCQYTFSGFAFVFVLNSSHPKGWDKKAQSRTLMEPQPLAPRAIVNPAPSLCGSQAPHPSQARALTDEQALPCGRHRPSYPGCPTLRASSSPRAIPRLWLISVSGTLPQHLAEWRPEGCAWWGENPTKGGEGLPTGAQLWLCYAHFWQVGRGKVGVGGVGGRVEVPKAGCLAWGQRSRVSGGSEMGRTAMRRVWKAGCPAGKSPLGNSPFLGPCPGVEHNPGGLRALFSGS